MRLTEEEIQVARVSEKKLRLTAVRETEVKLTRCQFLSTQFAKFETIHSIQSWEYWGNGHLFRCQCEYELLYVFPKVVWKEL